MPKFVRFLAVGLAMMPAAARAGSNTLRLGEDTIRAWEKYASSAAQSTEQRIRQGGRFLTVDAQPDNLKRVRNGEIITWPARSNGHWEVPGGMIHHWFGAMFLSDTNLDTVFDVLDDYDSYTAYYRPTVVTSALINEDGMRRIFSMRWVKHVLFVTTALDAQYESVYQRNGSNRWYSVTRSTRIEEIQNYGQPTQRTLPPDVGSGYLWRVCSVSRFEERDGGVYAELEALALTRTVPAYAAWFVNPIVNRLSRSAVVTSLSQTRDAVRLYSQSAPQLTRR